MTAFSEKHFLWKQVTREGKIKKRRFCIFAFQWSWWQHGEHRSGESPFRTRARAPGDGLPWLLYREWEWKEEIGKEVGKRKGERKRKENKKSEEEEERKGRLRERERVAPFLVRCAALQLWGEGEQAGSTTTGGRRKKEKGKKKKRRFGLVNRNDAFENNL